jgi:RNA polymerase sigma factor (sigma-70 family)
VEGNVLKNARQGNIWESIDNRDDVLKNILAGCIRNDSSCQEKLYKRYYGYAMSVALKYCYKREDAMEAVNDSFVKVFSKISQFNIESQFKPWFRRIIVNSAIDLIRANRKHAYQMDIEDAHFIECPVSVVSDLNTEQVLELLNHLPPLQRYAFNMYEIDGYSHQEIADLLGIPESSSRTHLARAKARLRMLYKKYYVE